VEKEVPEYSDKDEWVCLDFFAWSNGTQEWLTDLDEGPGTGNIYLVHKAFSLSLSLSLTASLVLARVI
jgi:hypothetical protein